MDNLDEMIRETTSRILNKHSSAEAWDRAEDGTFDEPLWQELEDAGLTLATMSEEAGGAELSLRSAVLMARATGTIAAPVPLAETLLAGRMLSAAGLGRPSGVASIGPVLSGDRLVFDRQSRTVTGGLKRLPWARRADFIVALVTDDDSIGVRTVVIPSQSVFREGINWANEPRDSITLDRVPLAPEAIGAAGQGLDVQTLRKEGALFRSAQMVGALETVLELSIAYAQERVQFGRPIAKFQAIQQQLAELASEVASAAAALDNAIDSDASLFAAAAVKVRVGNAAGKAANIAHRVTAAMGFSAEYPLHRYTRRLWSWRDEFGDEVQWSQWIGEVVCREGGAALWPVISEEIAV